VQTGDDVITPGNSEGGEVMLNTNGKVLGIGPDRIEFSNPIYHGNSGGPVFQVKTGKIIGIVTEAMKVEHSDDLDKASQASHQSAISGSMRYFGMRLDNVPQWEPYDWRRFQIESTFLEQFDQRSQYIISYFTYLSNLDSAAKKTKDKKPASADHDGVDPNLWQQDKDIFKANENYFDRATEDADSSEKLAALNEWFGEINDIANSNMDAIQNPANFYSFDQKKAQEEAAERKEIITDMDKIGNEFSRLGSMPRSNN